VPVGVNKFVFEADPPNTTRIPGSDILGVTVILLTCSYDDREFVRVGYYVNNEYIEQQLQDDPPAKPVIEKIRRNILADKPRVTRFQIKWDSEESAPSEYPPEQPEADAAEDDGTSYGAEELELEAALIAAAEEQDRELAAEGAGKPAGAGEEGEDATMEGVETEHGGAGGAKAAAEDEDEDDDESDAGSEDLEAESEGEGEGEGEEEDLEDEAAEGVASAAAGGEDHDMEIDEQHPGAEKQAHASANAMQH
jgi:histone chaperone ASF1